jgi:hypothetical protein
VFRIVKCTVYGHSCLVYTGNMVMAHEHVLRHSMLADELIRSCETLASQLNHVDLDVYQCWRLVLQMDSSDRDDSPVTVHRKSKTKAACHAQWQTLSPPPPLTGKNSIRFLRHTDRQTDRQTVWSSSEDAHIKNIQSAWQLYSTCWNLYLLTYDGKQCILNE